MGVVRRFKNLAAGMLLAFAAGWALPAASPLAPLHDPSVGEIPRKSLLRVFLSKKSDILIGGRLIANSKIHEIVEFRGVILSRDGYVVSYVGNYLPELSFPDVDTSIETSDGIRYPAQLVAVDEKLALMFLKAELKGDAVKLSSEEKPAHFTVVTLGEPDWQIGHPCLYSWEKKTVLPISRMKVSGLNLQTANWQGGIVLDLQGAMVGLVSDAMPHLTSKNLAYFYMIPALAIEASYSRIRKEKKDLLGGWLGVNIEDTGKYIVVSRVIPDSPADRGGLQANDRLLKLDDVEMENLAEFSQAVRWKGPDSNCHLTIERDGRISHLEIKLSARQHENLGWSVALPMGGNGQEADGKMRIYRTRVPPLLEFGLVIERLTSRVAGQKAALSQGALLVQQVLEGSRAEKVGLRVGDIIFEIDGHLVSSVEDVENSVLAAQGTILLGLVRDSRKMTLSIHLKNEE